MHLIISNIFAPLAFVGLYGYLGGLLLGVKFSLLTILSIPEMLDESLFIMLIFLAGYLPYSLFMLAFNVVSALEYEAKTLFIFMVVLSCGLMNLNARRYR